MSDMPIYKLKVKAATADEASLIAQDKARKDGCDVYGAEMPILLSEGEWEVPITVAEAPKKTLKSILTPKKKPSKKKED